VSVKGGVVSESEHLPQGKSETEVAIETFVDRIEGIYPNLDREQFHDAISRCTHENVPDEDGDEEE